MMKRLVYYVFDENLLNISKNISNICNRALVVHSLISSYDLLTKCENIQGETASDEDILSFHSSEYLNYLKKVQTSSNLEALTNAEITEEFNLGYDCPLFEEIYDFVRIIAGSSLSAARKITGKKATANARDRRCDPSDITTAGHHKPRSYLRFKYEKNESHEKEDVFELPGNLSADEGTRYALEAPQEGFRLRAGGVVRDRSSPGESADIDSDTQLVAVNWFGGWHHAQRHGAEGFCYVNDIVIAILHLLKTFSRILYVDLDVHHGNAVENAFLFSRRVFVLDLHKYEAGFYPATGAVDDVGRGTGRFYTCNIPLKDGITDQMYGRVFAEVVEKVSMKFKPECIVVQCGADAVAGDPLGGFNLTPVGLGECLRMIVDKKLPTLVLGGGGYNIPNVAKCWTYLTSIVLGCPLSSDIPENPFFHLFGPAFEIGVTPSLRRNENTQEYLRGIVDRVLRNLDCLPDD